MPASAWLRFAPWAVGILGLVALISVVLNFGEIEHFTQLLRDARPQWLLVAIALQSLTYFCAASVWQRTLAAAGAPVPLLSLAPLSLAKLFTDQAVPAVGLGGTVVVARGLLRRGVGAELAAEALLMTLLTFYGAYFIAALAAIALLWARQQVNPWIVALAAIFSVIAVGVPTIAFWIKQRGREKLPGWLARFPGFAASFAKFATAPTDLLKRKRLVATCVAFQLCVFLLDAATLWVAFRALGQQVPFASAFTGFMLASLVATVGPIPAGIGTFEASAVGTFTMLGVEIEAALTATLLLRGFTLWLPLLPGLFFARREIGGMPARIQPRE